ncbi:hypothetical protein [Nocardia jejuensis]|uniref:hypothetical protein n=1 Tax=Nocardia jejuensis TaxID=328049 RepID=UPI000836279C|nr:hypothetical protein [Nocardia jejuensis]
MKRALIVVAALALLAGYVGAVPDSPWREVPAPAPGARVLRIVPFGAGVLALGSVPRGTDREPAAWETDDGIRWRAVPVRPHSGYAFGAELISVGVGDRLVVLGQAFGGAHSNPRMTVWSGDATGLEEYPQVVEMFGGPHAIAVTGAAALGGIDLLAGGWDGPGGRYGAAVWTSGDGARWTRHSDDPALSSAPGELTGVAEVTVGPRGFVMVGQTLRGGATRALQWISRDGVTWQRIELPGANALASRVGCDAHGCVVLGQTTGPTPRLRCWPSSGAAVDGPGAAQVDLSQVLLREGRALVVVRLNGVVHLDSLNAECDGRQEISLPVRAGRAQVGLLPSGVLMATDDGGSSRLWVRALPRRDG